MNTQTNSTADFNTVEFYLNRAYHHEAEASIKRLRTEHAALVAVAEQAGNILRSLERHTLCGQVDIYSKTYTALAVDRDSLTDTLAHLASIRGN